MADWTLLKNKKATKNKLNLLIFIGIFVHLSLPFIRVFFHINGEEESGRYLRVNAKSGLKLRNCPSGKVLLTIRDNEQVILVTDSSYNGWRKVSYSNVVGFVKSEYISK